MENKVIVQTTVQAPIERVWEYWTGLEHINNWAFASDDWGAEAVTNDLHEGGKFLTKMFAKDGSAGFDFGGSYTSVKDKDAITYVMDDEREVVTTFESSPDGVHITQAFDPENVNPKEMQQAGWQAFLENFKRYVESVE